MEGYIPQSSAVTAPFRQGGHGKGALYTMKATGIVRRIDDLGRIVIPKEIRRTMRIREGDPLEIFTENNGTVIFKKYSPIGELGEFASQYAEALSKSTGVPTCITDKDNIIAVSGIPKKELKEKKVSGDMEKIMHARTIYMAKPDGKGVQIADGTDRYEAGVVAPILFEGDSIGTVVFIADSSAKIGEVESKLAETAAGFLGRTME